jgi:hypothetical protein
MIKIVQEDSLDSCVTICGTGEIHYQEQILSLMHQPGFFV